MSFHRLSMSYLLPRCTGRHGCSKFFHKLPDSFPSVREFIIVDAVFLVIFIGRVADFPARPFHTSFTIYDSLVKESILLSLSSCNTLGNLFAKPFSAVLTDVHRCQNGIDISSTMSISLNQLHELFQHFFVLIARIYIIVSHVYHIYKVSKPLGKVL